MRRPELTAELVARVHRRLPDPGPDPDRVPMSDADYGEALAKIAAGRPAGDFWVFGYGSLLWNPGFAFAARRPARLTGWHRVFCMRLNRFRGSPEQPGLMLALDHGGSCLGEAFRLAPGSEAVELPKLLRREVPFRRAATAWRWVTVEAAGQRHPALTFYAGMRGDRYYERLPIARQAELLARAAGHGGSGAEYLHETVSHLAAAGIHDSYLWELERLVAAEIRAMHPDLGR